MFLIDGMFSAVIWLFSQLGIQDPYIVQNNVILLQNELFRPIPIYSPIILPNNS